MGFSESQNSNAQHCESFTAACKNAVTTCNVESNFRRKVNKLKTPVIYCLCCNTKLSMSISYA